jgi:hypothetical protein
VRPGASPRMRRLERRNASLVDRPELMGDRKSLTLYVGMDGMPENVFINVKNHSKTIRLGRE